MCSFLRSTAESDGDWTIHRTLSAGKRFSRPVFLIYSMSSAIGMVDPRAPRFGQAVTTSLAVGGLAFQEPALIYVLTTLLVVAVASRWRIDPYRFLWKRVQGFVGPPTETESALPHRFARVVGAIFTTVASGCLLLAGTTGIGLFALAGYGIVVVVGVLAALGAFANFCLGCRMYRQQSVFKGWKLLTTPAEDAEALSRR